MGTMADLVSLDRTAFQGRQHCVGRVGVILLPPAPVASLQCKSVHQAYLSDTAFAYPIPRL